MSSGVQSSIEIIKANQSDTGAYIASPSFAHYRYSWLRDGTFIAYAMDRVGQHDSAHRFYEWCHQVIQRHEQKGRKAIEAVKNREGSMDEHQFLHTRYTIDGNEVPGHWGNFQLDGYGTWLWGLQEHLSAVGKEQFALYRSSVELTVDYLQACWFLPNYDCWEEFGDRVHPASLAAIYGGLYAIAEFLPERQESILRTCQEIKEFVNSHAIVDGAFVKSVGNTSVDASLLWLAIPFGIVELTDPIFEKTVQKIRARIVHGSGVHRYPEDVYYGGGQWILLSAWLGWYEAQTDQIERAKEILRWIESKFTDKGLPEQVQDVLLSHRDYDSWVQQAGEPADPLLWSHAMYLVLHQELQSR